MPIKRFFEYGADYVMEITADRYHAFPKASVSDDQAGSDYLASLLQNEIDQKHLLNTYDNDDPVRDADPGLPYLFWIGTGHPTQTTVVSRPILVTCIWNGSNHEVRFERLL